MPIPRFAIALLADTTGAGRVIAWKTEVKTRPVYFPGERERSPSAEPGCCIRQATRQGDLGFLCAITRIERLA